MFSTCFLKQHELHEHKKCKATFLVKADYSTQRYSNSHFFKIIFCQHSKYTDSVQ